MDRELLGALAELGLSATEAEVYVALLGGCGDGPISAYKLAQAMGRDPANLTKILSVMVRRGAVRAAGRPRRYAPVPPDDFTGRLLGRLQERRKLALRLLADIGRPPPDHDLHPLATYREALLAAGRLVGGARHRVLADGAAGPVADLAEALAGAARRGVTVEVRCPEGPDLPGVAVRAGGLPAKLAGEAPGPWLRLVVDGEASLELVREQGGGEALLCGHWTINPGRAYLAGRAVASELVLDAPPVSAPAVNEPAEAEAAAGERDEPLRFVYRRPRD